MNIKIPTTEEIHVAYQQGEQGVFILVESLGRQIIELGQELKKQSEVIEELQGRLAKDK